MSNSTVTLQSTLNWAQAFLGYAPLNLGSLNEPAITSANIVARTMLSPPFRWRWNRNAVTVTTAASTQDYSTAVAPGMGFLEKASLSYASGTVELETKTVMALAGESARPVYISAQSDDNAGNISFRFIPVPDAIYTVTVTYQGYPPTLTSLASLWSPIPDAFQHIYSWGFLSLMYEYFGSPRSAFARQVFVGSLLSIAEGLSEEEKTLFHKTWTLGAAEANIKERQAAVMSEEVSRSRQALLV